MFNDDEKSVSRIRNQRTLFSAWIAAAAFAVVVTMTAGIFTSANAASDALQASLMAAEQHRTLMTGLIVASFGVMVAGAISLTRRPLREVAKCENRIGKNR